MSAEHRAQVLRAAAQAKRTATTKRAEAALRKLIKTGEEINFRAVSSTAGVSVDFLYRVCGRRSRGRAVLGQCLQRLAVPRASADKGA